MFLQSVTLQGFKSFADKTTLVFEPGITVVVGPNGSGKSNVVDALTWVLGTHSPKTLRGGQMADVIFAGAPGRRALGRASVEIRIDNTSGVLPIDFTEVTVSRSMYASGENEYAINGVSCRLLDVSELLSDTGLGRENHTIVGQGRLDAVLNARPEERRAFIEEAAGILKHRRRKERALRKLSQLEEHLERLGDLLIELERQLGPLERQAQAATRHAELRARRDAVALVLALQSYDRAADELGDQRGRAAELAARYDRQQAQVAELAASERQLESAITEGEPRVRRAAATHVHLSTVSERLQGLVGRIDERREGLLAAVEEPVAGRDPAALRQEADQHERTSGQVDAQLQIAERLLVERVEQRTAAEQRRRTHERAVADEQRRVAEVRERRLRREGQIAALRSQLSQAEGEEARLTVQVGALENRRQGLHEDLEHAREEIQHLDAAAPQLARRLEDANRRLVRRSDRNDDLVSAERELERQRASLQARAEALRATAERADEGVTAVLSAARSGGIEGVVGQLSDELVVDQAHAAAVARALGEMGAALVVDTSDHARDILSWARNRSGVVQLLPAADDGVHASADRPSPEVTAADVRSAAIAAAGGTPLADVIGAPPAVEAALSRLLHDTWLVADLDTAVQLSASFPTSWFVTTAGEAAGARGWKAGLEGEPPAVLALAGAREAERRLEAVQSELSVIHRQLADADRELQAAREEVDTASLVLQESDGRITAAAERLHRLQAEGDRTGRELGERRGQLEDLRRLMADRERQLADLTAADDASSSDEVASAHVTAGHGLHAAAGERRPGAPDEEAQRLDDAVERCREAEVEARLEVRSVRDRLAQIADRVQQLRQEAADVEEQMRERERRRRLRLAAIERCGQLRSVAVRAAEIAVASRGAADSERSAIDARQSARREELGGVRERLRERQQALSETGGQQHATALRLQELEATAVGLREEIVALVGADAGADADALLAQARRAPRDALPSDDVDVTGDVMAAPLAGGADRRERLEAARRRLERQIGQLGDVNPLARVEFERATERHGFMQSQLDDVRASRHDLQEVIEAVDARIEEVFAEAFADVARAFDEIFPRLFPGGEGQLVLTEPGALLTSGVDVEARPAGKRVKRLSLLSGGERSLTALAVVFAIFAARPSPFYVLDEVEAALDDVNLQRFLDVVTDFRASSQIILVTHQKRTMETADVLYGVSMQRDGVSRVIGQRAGELVPQS